MKSLEHTTCEEQLRSVGLLSPEQRLRGGLMAAAAPHRERRGSAELCSGNGMELCQGRGSGGSRNGSAPEGGGHGTACPGQWAQP